MNSPDAPQVSIALQTDKHAADYAALATAVEGFGFDGISVFADLGFQPPAPALAILAEHTDRVRLGAACHSVLLSHPVQIAAEVATTDLLSDGRSYCGLARGSWLTGLGLPPADGLTRLAESVAVIRAVLSGDTGGFTGRTVQLPAGFRLQGLVPARMPELLIGTWGPRTARLAVRLGATEIKIGGTANPEMVATMRRWAGDGVRIVAGAVTACDTDGASARALARREVCLYLDVVAGLDPTVQVPAAVTDRIADALRAGDPDAAAAAVDDELLDRFCFAGTPEQITDRATSLVAAGADRIEFGTPHGLEPLRGVELLGSRVLPALRRLGVR